MRYLKDGEEVAQVGDIPFAQACGHSLGSDSLSFPSESPQPPRAYLGPPRPGQKFSFLLRYSRLGPLARAQP